MPPARSLGVEEEFQVVDLESWRLASRAPQLLSRLPEEGYSAELQRSTVETNTAVCQTSGDLLAEVVRLRGGLIDAAAQDGLGVAASGTAPLSRVEDLNLTALGRYLRMQQDYRLLVDEHLVCGLQVHVGVDDPDLAIRLVPRLETALPVLLALSASSPFFGGNDTGYASARTMLWRRWPTSGRAAVVDSYAEYEKQMDTMIEAGVIADSKMAYFDVRPSSHVPTLELRVCDSCPLIDDVILISVLFRSVVEQAVAAERDGLPLEVRPGPLYQASMWRAARSGLSDVLLDESPEATARPAADVVHQLLNRVRPELEEAGDWETAAELAAAALARGSSSERQRARYAERGRLADVVDLVVAETAGRSAGSVARTRWSAGYRAGPVDEAVHPSGAPYGSYQAMFDVLEQFDAAETIRRTGRLRGLASEQGLTFGVGGEQRPFPVDLVPRVIPAHEWAILAAGLTQRARAIESFLRDIYGAAEIVRDGAMGFDDVNQRGWRAEGTWLPDDTVRAPVIGFDLVRDGIGGWRVLEDNARVPSGIGYAIAARRLMRAVMPELNDLTPILDAEDALAIVGRTMRACSAAAHPEVALLSEGADNSGWYEHRLIADELGFLLAQPGEIEIRGGRVTVGGRRVDVLYLRLGCELVDLVDGSGRPVGAGILDVARSGGVAVVNAPGNGVADDKAMYCLVPQMIDYYLGERPLLAPVPTYRCADPGERQAVLDRLDQLVTKPVDGYGGAGVLIGPSADRGQLDRRRKEIAADPGAWVAQEVVALSTLPAFSNGQLESRHVDLRAFVYVTGTRPGDAELAGLALSRTAPSGSMLVNSSLGGGAKDTWILRDPEDRDPEDRGPGERFTSDTEGGGHVRTGG